MSLVETASIHGLDEMCLTEGDVYGFQQYQQLIRLNNQLVEMRRQVETGQEIDEKRYWVVFDEISQLEQKISQSARSPFELGKKQRRKLIIGRGS